MSMQASSQFIPHHLDDGVAMQEGGRATSLINLRVGGIVCPHCPPTIEKALRAVPELDAEVAFRGGHFDPGDDAELSRSHSRSRMNADGERRATDHSGAAGSAQPAGPALLACGTLKHRTLIVE